MKHVAIAVLFAAVPLIAVTSARAGAADAIPVTSTARQDNPALTSLYEDDQADRAGDAMQRDPDGVMRRDGARRDAVLRLLTAGDLRTAADHYHAAMVFQHAHGDIRLAHALATIASQLDPDTPRYRWLIAASWDRLLMQQMQPQWYGTQYQGDAQGMYLFPVAEDAVSDEARVAMGVPTLDESRARLDEMAKMLGLAPRAIQPTIEALRAERDAAQAAETGPAAQAPSLQATED